MSRIGLSTHPPPPPGDLNSKLTSSLEKKSHPDSRDPPVPATIKLGLPLHLHSLLRRARQRHHRVRPANGAHPPPVEGARRLHLDLGFWRRHAGEGRGAPRALRGRGTRDAHPRGLLPRRRRVERGRRRGQGRRVCHVEYPPRRGHEGAREAVLVEHAGLGGESGGPLDVEVPPSSRGLSPRMTWTD